ncbi:MAG: lactonase family protein [Bacteroidota bacterium]
MDQNEFDDYELIIGTYTKKEGHVDGKAPGITGFSFQDQYKIASANIINDELINPSYLTVDKSGEWIYAVSETGPDVDSVGHVYALQVQEDGTWQIKNKQSTFAFAPCYVAIHPDGDHLAVANYVGGVVALYPIADDGSLGAATSVIRFEGGTDHPRQDSSHPHATVFSKDGRYCYVPDLGANKIWVLGVDKVNGQFVRLDEVDIEVDPQAGPRHAIFHPFLDYLYVANELSNTVMVYRKEANGPQLEKLQTISTLPQDFTGDSYVADIHITKDGRHLYVSNRGQNALAHFEVNQENGQLQAGGHYTSGGDFPRNFVIYPTIQKLYVANQNSDNILEYNILSDGSLVTPKELTSPTPVCLKFRSVKYSEN